MISEKELKKVLKLTGKVRGVTLKTDADYIIYTRGKEDFDKLQEEIKKINPKIDYFKIKNTEWYPVGWRILSLLVIKDFFNWSDKDIFKMGFSAPKHSFIVKLLLRYFVSWEKNFKESSKYWEKHWSIGELEPVEYNEKKKFLILRLKNFKTHPILCTFLQGYFKAIVKMTIKSDKLTVKENKCFFRDDKYHEFYIQW